MDLDGSLDRTTPSHAARTMASLPGSEDFLDAATNPVDRPVSSIAPLEGFYPDAAPHAGSNDPWSAALGPHRITKVISTIGAVGEDLAWTVRQGIRSGLAVADIGSSYRTSSTSAVSASEPICALKPRTAGLPLCLTQCA